MKTNVTKGEKEFLAKVKNLNYKAGGSFILSAKNKIYHGIPFEVAKYIHGEENAIGSMLTAEGLRAKFKLLVVIGAESEIIEPCGMCRVAIKHYATNNAAILCITKNFSHTTKFTVAELYPYPPANKYMF